RGRRGRRRGWRRWRRGRRRRGRLPVELLRVQPLLDAERAVHPRAVAVGEGCVVVGLAPDKEPLGGLLQAVAVQRVEVLVDQAVADGRWPDHVAQRLEAELEVASG